MDNNNHTDDELIDKYLTEKLSEAEDLLFQKKLKEPAFQKAVAEMQLLKSGITTSELRRVKNLLQSEEKKLNSDQQTNIPIPKPKRSLAPMLLKIAAILVGVSIVFWWVNTRNNTQEDYLAQYFSPLKNTVVTIDRSSVDSSLLAQSFSNYENKDYEQAIQEFDRLIVATDNDDYRLFKANALLATEQTDQAIAILNKIIQNNNSQFLDDTKWYLALAYLHKKQTTLARPLLESLRSHPFYKNKANAILQTLP